MLQRILNSLKKIVQKVKDIIGEYSKKLHIRKNGTVEDITLYTNSDVSNNTIKVRDGSTICYVPIGATDDSNASSLRVRKNGTTYAVLKQGGVKNKFIVNSVDNSPYSYAVNRKITLNNGVTYTMHADNWYDINGYWVIDIGSELLVQDSEVHNVNDCLVLMTRLDSSITAAMFSPGGVFYDYFMKSKIKVYREKTGYGLVWTGAVIVDTIDRGHVGRIVTPISESAIPVSAGNDSAVTVWENLQYYFDDGENLVIELG